VPTMRRQKLSDYDTKRHHTVTTPAAETLMDLRHSRSPMMHITIDNGCNRAVRYKCWTRRLSRNPAGGEASLTAAVAMPGLAG